MFYFIERFGSGRGLQLPDLPQGFINGVDNLVSQMPSFCPWQETDVVTGQEIRLGAVDIESERFAVEMQREHPYKNNWLVIMGPTLQILEFHPPEDNSYCPSIAYKRGLENFAWVEVASIESSNRGKGWGRRASLLMDKLLQKFAQDQNTPLFAWAVDDSGLQRWSTAAFQELGYNKQRRVAEWINPKRGSALYKWY